MDAFPAALGDPDHKPFFSVEDPTVWITSLRYQLFLLHDDSEVFPSSWNAEDESARDLKAYRSYVEKYLDLPFFSLENTERWINPTAFEAYMASIHGSFEQYRTKDSTPFSSRAPSRAASSISYTHSRSPVSFAASDICSRPQSAMSVDAPVSLGTSDAPGHGEGVPEPIVLPEHGLILAQEPDRPALPSISVTGKVNQRTTKSRRKGKAKAKPDSQIAITRECKVNEIIDSSTVPSTWPVLRGNVATRLDLSNSC
ncbi:hypothetical protein DFH09DRAFT_1096328 [Mycena vulgaris]|nr:hypothetical protein DFH09DRAFT_1096328 [Mycena vulgaris]